MSQEKIHEIIFDKKDVTWQSMLIDLVKQENMNPWDINIKLVAEKFIGMTKEMKELDFRIPGKVILAAAILLKIKSNRLLGEDISNLDALFAQGDEEEGLLDELIDDFDIQRGVFKDKNLGLIPRTPQPRKRKVSIYDLVDALQKAIEVKRRRVLRDIPSIEVTVPKKTMDIGEAITNVYGKVKNYFRKNSKTLSFHQLIPSEGKYDKVYTFIPLLHLTNQRKLDLMQFRHFGNIEIKMLKENKKDLDEALT